MKLLIAEFSSHWKVLENTYRLLKKNARAIDTTLFINDQGAEKRLIQLLFKDSEKAKWKIHKYHSSTYFIHLLFIGYKYDIINVSTGPEDPHYSNLLNTIFLYLCSIIYKKKIVLTIKNTRPYLKSTSGIKSFFLHISTLNIKVITFESETLKNIFHDETKIPKKRLCTSYDRYVDFNNRRSLQMKPAESLNRKYRIGLLGAVEEIRRDYQDLIVALQNLPSDKRKKIELVTLGNSNGGTLNPVLVELMKLVDVDATDGWISVDEFDDRGGSCHLLISPLKPEMEYGTYKGSGTFGDAVYLKKKVIIPSFVDPFHEFEEIAFYYSNIGSLTELFNDLESLVKSDVREDFYNKFSSKAVFDNLKNVMITNGIGR